MQLISNHKLYEEFIDSADAQDIVMDSIEDEVVIGKTSVQIYAAPFAYTTVVDLRRLYKRVGLLADRTPGLKNATLGNMFSWGETAGEHGDWVKSLNDYKNLSKDFSFKGRGYYCVEIICKPEFNNAVSLLRFLSSIQSCTKGFNLSYAIFKTEEELIEFDESFWAEAIMKAYNNGEMKDINKKEFSYTRAWRQMQALGYRFVKSKNFVETYNRITELFDYNIASQIEDTVIRRLMTRIGSTDKCRKVSLKADAVNPLKIVDIDGTQLKGSSSQMWLNVYDAYTEKLEGDFSTDHLHADVKEIMDELKSNPRKFQQIRVQTFNGQFAALICYLGLFWVNSLGKLVNVSYTYKTWLGEEDMGHYKYLFNWCQDVMKRFSGEDKSVYRLYNDIVKTIEK